MLSVVCCGVSVWAGNTCTWKSDELTTSSDWTAATNYVEGVAPQKGNGDRVVIPANKTVLLKANDAKSCEVVSDFGLVSIRMLGRRTDSGVRRTGTLIVEVGPEDPDVSISCPVYGSRYDTQDGYDGNSGQVVKRGTGALYLCSTNSTAANASKPGRYDYDTTLVVEAGDLYLPQGIVPAELSYYALAISNNATLHLADLPAAKPTHYVGLLFGEENALVTNSHENAHSDCQFHVSGGEYAGVLANLRFLSREGNSRATRLTGSRSTMTSNVTADWNRGAGPSESASSTLCFTTIGRSGEPSSVGTGGALVFGQVGGAFAYEGADETTDKALYFQYPGNNILFFDAGPNGGLVFDSDSKWNIGYTQAANFRMASLVLQGDNARPCEIAAEIEAKVNNSVTNRVFITKRGSGAWRFRDNTKRSGIGGLAVEEGTLQFDSLEERGIMTALGDGVDVHSDYYGEYDASKRVDYNFNLGAATTEGAMEYTGTAGAWTGTRPIVLSGDARLSNNGSAPFRFSGVTPKTAGGKKLTLDGSGTGENVIADVVDTAADPISIVKEGNGTWVLSNTNATLHGSLSVEGGTLKVRSPAGKYTWYLWHVRGVLFPDGDPTGVSAGKPDSVQVEELALYRTNDYMRVNLGMTYQADYLSIQPGQVAYFDRRTYSGKNLGNLFDGSKGTRWSTLVNGKVPRTDDPSSWCKIVQRFAADVPEIGGYDFQCWFGYPYSDKTRFDLFGKDPLSWSLSGSVDGIHWDNVHDITNALSETSDMRVGPWSDRFYAAQSQDDALQSCSTNSHHVVGHSSSTVNPLAHVTSVKVAKGATLVAEGAPMEVKGLVIDAVDAGTLDNFTFAEEGTLDVLNLPKGGSVELPLEFANVPAEEIAKLANWSLTIGGEVKSSKSIAIRNGKVCIDSSGLMLIFR